MGTRPVGRSDPIPLAIPPRSGDCEPGTGWFGRPQPRFGSQVERAIHLQKGVYEVGYTRPGYCLTSEGKLVKMKFDRLAQIDR